MDGQTTKKVNIFYCYADYADKDLKMLNELDKHLNVLKSRGWIQSWHEGEISPGTERDRKVEEQLNAADIILFFVSADFLASPRCDLQMQLALERCKNRQATVIPLLIRAADWQNSPLSEFHILPENGKPVDQWKNIDEVLHDIANGIQLVVKKLLEGIYLASVPAESSFVLRLQRDLEDRGIIVWSAPKEQSIDREKTVQQMILVARIVVLIASPSTKYARSIQEELRIAHMYQKLIAPLWVAGNTWQEAAPRQLVQGSYFDGRTPEDYENALGRILTLYNRVGNIGPPPPPALLPEPRNPYKALRAFSNEDTDDFFGREKLTSELVEAMREILTIKNKDQSERFLAVIGPSGVGKSSVVMAGLLPCLQQGALSGSENWVYLIMPPGEHPVESLALVLAKERSGEPPVEAIRDDLIAKGARGLYWQAFKLMKSPGTKIVLVVYQFEELFTQPSEEERQHFIELLVAAAKDPQSPVIVIVTLRADFYDRLMNDPELRKLIETPSKKIHSRFVPPMDIDELRTVIEKPAALPEVQLSFDEDLVGDLLFETRGQAGALPLLEFTLDQLFQRRRGQQLTRQAYEDIGGVKGALKNQAKSTFDALPSEEHRQLVRVLFLRLIDPGMAEQDTTRRRTALSEFSLGNDHQNRLMQETIDEFITARLLTTNTIAGIPTIEISHEALIREWPRLLDWLRTDRNDILLQQAISEDAAAWIHSGKSEDRLYRGTQLLEAQVWTERNKANMDEVAFLEASVAEQERRAREERERVERELDLQQRATRRQRYVIGMIGVTSVVLIFGLIVSLVLQNNLLVTQRNLVTTQNNLLASLPVSVTNLHDKGPGSLREAIATAAPGSTITFAKYLKGTLTLTSGELTIDKNLTISGPGASLLTISGDNSSRVFHVLDNVVATVSNLTIKDGKASLGAGIDNIGTLSLSNIVVFSNTAMKDSSNSAPNGGGIGNAGTLFLAKSVISANESDYGGGIVNLGTLYFTDGTISSNTAHSQGGGIYNLGNFTLHNSTVSNNRSYAPGGGIFNGGRGTTSDNSIFSISNSTVSGNKANTDGGGIYNDGTSAPFKAGTLTLTNSTISGNTSNGNGGGIDSPGNTSITYCTVYGNTARSGGGIAIIYNGSLTVKTSIIASDKANIGPDVLGPITLIYPNLIQNISAAKITFGSDPRDPTTNAYSRKSIFGQSPNLGPLQGNDGPTQTQALLPGSPAIGQIPPLVGSSLCGFNGLTIVIDQRNSSRPRVLGPGKSCDLGAYEYS